MRWILIGVTGFAATGVAAAQVAGHAQPYGRQVQLITMIAHPNTLPDPSPSPEPPRPDGRNVLRAHVPGRLWIARQMAGSFAPEAGNDHNLAGAQLPLVAPVSDITVPTWMRGLPTTTGSAMARPLECGIASYRATGFLRPAAEGRRANYFGLMAQIACEYGIPVGLFDAMIIQESRYQPDIFSPKNAFGLTQLMPGTAAALGVNRFLPEDNLRGGARYLRQQLDRFGYPHLALAAYNAGPGRVRGGLVPTIAETQRYVDSVLANWSRLAGPVRSATIVQPGVIATERKAALAGRRTTIFTF